MRTFFPFVASLMLAGCGAAASDSPPMDGSSPADAGSPSADDGGTKFGSPPPADLATTTSGDGAVAGGLSAAQKAVAEALTSIWENDTPILAYAYAENIHDGRGYTSGRAGFCTGTGDAIQVIACYDMLRTAANGNLMAKYMPALTTINNNFMSTGMNQGDTSLLDAVGSWIADWGTSYNDTTTRADFKSCQDQVSDLLYYAPAMQAATHNGLMTALTRAALYDMWINQGDDALVTKTNAALGAAPTEDAWLKKFLELRRDLLAGDATWKTSVDRVAGYEKARRRGNWDLSQPVDSAVKASECWPTGGYLDSGYSAFVIAPDASSMTTTVAPACQ